MKCPHCGYKPGNYSTVEYKCIDNNLKSQDYWFCHTCARIVYDDEQHFTKQEQQ